MELLLFFIFLFALLALHGPHAGVKARDSRHARKDLPTDG